MPARGVTCGMRSCRAVHKRRAGDSESPGNSPSRRNSQIARCSPRSQRIRRLAPRLAAVAMRPSRPGWPKSIGGPMPRSTCGTARPAKKSRTLPRRCSPLAKRRPMRRQICDELLKIAISRRLLGPPAAFDLAAYVEPNNEVAQALRKALTRSRPANPLGGRAELAARGERDDGLGPRSAAQ